MTKQEVTKAFQQFILPGLQTISEGNGRCNKAAREYAWKGWVSTFRKNGKITAKQNALWQMPPPRICELKGMAGLRGR